MIYGEASSIGSLEPRLEQLLEEIPQCKWAQTQDAIACTDEDLRKIWIPHDDPIVISLTIMNYDAKRILVDNGSLADILFYDAF